MRNARVAGSGCGRGDAPSNDDEHTHRRRDQLLLVVQEQLFLHIIPHGFGQRCDLESGVVVVIGLQVYGHVDKSQPRVLFEPSRNAWHLSLSSLRKRRDRFTEICSLPPHLGAVQQTESAQTVATGPSFMRLMRSGWELPLVGSLSFRIIHSAGALTSALNRAIRRLFGPLIRELWQFRSGHQTDGNACVSYLFQVAQFKRLLVSLACWSCTRLSKALFEVLIRRFTCHGVLHSLSRL